MKGVARLADGSIGVVDVATVGEDAPLVHDAHADDPGVAFSLSRLSDPTTLDDTPIGVFRDVQRPTYDSLMADQIDRAVATQGEGDLGALLAGSDTWVIN